MIRVQQNIQRTSKKRCYHEIDQSFESKQILPNDSEIAYRQLEEFKSLLDIQKKQIIEFNNMLQEYKILAKDIKQHCLLINCDETKCEKNSDESIRLHQNKEFDYYN